MHVCTCSPGTQCNAIQRYSPCTVSPSSRAGGDFANTSQPPPIPACHTFDLAAGGLRKPRSPRSPGAAVRCCMYAAAGRAASSSTPTYRLSARADHLGPHPRPSPWPCPASPRLVFPLAPWYTVCHGMVLSQSICSLRRPLSAVRWASPHSPVQTSLSEKGPRRSNTRQVYCDTRILMLVCPASAESLSQTDPCAWRTMALASR